MLAQVADKTVEYETNRYGQQRLIAFSNWPTTDPFEYPATIATSFDKCAQVDTEHILPSAKFKSGRFASYHVYPYYPDYANLLLELDTRRQKGLTIYHARAQALLKRPGALSREQRIWAEWAERIAGDYKDPSGRYNTYYTYLRVLTSHHTMPVVISEFGVSTGRGMAPVSYTHLDVYKRQGFSIAIRRRNGKQFRCKTDSLLTKQYFCPYDGLGQFIAHIIKRQIRRKAETQSSVSNACLLYTSRCV